MSSLNEHSLVAPCGINCEVCKVYLREKNKCPGCRGDDAGKPVTRVRCKIKTCEVFKEGEAEFCFECEDSPCQSLERLDKRYRARYHMSPMENLETIQNEGIEKFLENEKVKWTCSECGGTISVHNGHCSSCGKK